MSEYWDNQWARKLEPLPHWIDGYAVKDETHLFQKGDLIELGPQPKSKIRVTFNRPWTWSEREEFRQALKDGREDPGNVRIFSEGFTEKGLVLTIQGDLESRELYEMVADYVEHALVNLHPVAVLTVYPKEVM